MNGRIMPSLISPFLVFALVIAASAQTRMVGVDIGDTFRYSVTTSWSSDDPNATTPSYIVDYKNTEWLEVSVTAISGTNITGNTRQRFWNETETTVEGWVDVDTGNGSLRVFFISANLTAGDSVYTSSSSELINATVSKTYLDGVRDTNNMNMTSHVYISNMSYRLCWDKLTGVLVDWFVENTYPNGNYTNSWSVEFQIISSDLWVVPEFSTWTLAMLMLIVFTSGIMKISRQRAHRRLSTQAGAVS